MKLFKLAKNFKNDESGAVTVDWVVLTAALVGLGLAVITVVRGRHAVSHPVAAWSYMAWGRILPAASKKVRPLRTRGGLSNKVAP